MQQREKTQTVFWGICRVPGVDPNTCQASACKISAFEPYYMDVRVDGSESITMPSREAVNDIG